MDECAWLKGGLVICIPLQRLFFGGIFGTWDGEVKQSFKNVFYANIE